MRVLLVQIDGALPNLALMMLAKAHEEDEVKFVRVRDLPTVENEPWDRVYASAIFAFSTAKVEKVKQTFPHAIIGGTGTINKTTVEEVLGRSDVGYSYAIYPEFKDSIGFTQRGCRLSCKFCVVPQKEGKNKSTASIEEIWRGGKHPKKLHLLDNDFFGQPREQWQARVRELQDGKFRICLSQGINVRLIDDESAAALASIQYRDTKFSCRRLYTAWDNLRDERIFFDGVMKLDRAGIPTKHLMAYMLIGYDITETWERLWYRFNKMVAAGIRPYPMVYDRTRSDLLAFQRWVVMGLYRVVPWPDYRRQTKTDASVAGWHRAQELTA